jgi:hypothetical protein
MTEKEFWAFLKMSIAVNGRMDQVSGYIDSDNRDIQENGRYLGGHSVLFNGYDNLPEDRIKEIGSILFDPVVSKSAKEAVLMILAHYPKRCALKLLDRYNRNPDKELKYFAEIALWECRMWNE